jgi:hypothetical protein
MNRNLWWFDKWAAQVSLTLTIDESTLANPFFNWIPQGGVPTNIFNIGVGGNFSADAQRVDKIGNFFTIAELKELAQCNAVDRDRAVHT